MPSAPAGYSGPLVNRAGPSGAQPRARGCRPSSGALGSLPTSGSWRGGRGPREGPGVWPQVLLWVLPQALRQPGSQRVGCRLNGVAKSCLAPPQSLFLKHYLLPRKRVSTASVAPAAPTSVPPKHCASSKWVQQGPATPLTLNRVSRHCRHCGVPKTFPVPPNSQGVSPTPRSARSPLRQ